MSTTAESDTSEADDFADDPPTEPAGSSEILLGAGQSMWLALITVGTILALVLSIVAIVMSRSEGSTESAGSGPSAELSLAAVDIAFEPSAWSVIADADAAITVNNEGAADHNWTALALGTTIAAEEEFDESMVLVATEDLAAGASETINETFPTGSYQVICTIAGHFASGMVGTLTAS